MLSILHSFLINLIDNYDLSREYSPNYDHLSVHDSRVSKAIVDQTL